MSTPTPTIFDVAILLDGGLTSTVRLRTQVRGARVIAADGGMRHALPLSLQPELWVGDFDSAPSDLIDRYAHVPRLQVPTRKAVSDGELAIGHARDWGARTMLLCGALGGPRSDHALLNVLFASRLAQDRAISIRLTSGHEEAWPLSSGDALMPDLPAGTVFSIIALSNLTGLDVQGAEWPLSDADVARGSSLTLSNIARNDLAVRLVSGQALLLAQLKHCF